MCVCVCACLCSCVRLNEGRKNEAKVLILFLFVVGSPSLMCFLKMNFFFFLQILKVHAGRKYLPLFLRLSFEIIRKV